MARKEENLRSCSICKHLESFESDEVCWLLCTKKEIDFTFHGENMEKTAKECDSYEED